MPRPSMPVEREPLPTWVRVILLILLLALFLLAIKLMGGAFKTLGKEQAKALFEGISNPFAGLAVGILATVLVQSSSVTTATVVALVGGGDISIAYAVPMVMGANIGTSVTNTLVSMGHITRREEFRRAFAGATMHDFFNLMALVVLLPLELATGLLEKGARWLTTLLATDPSGEGSFKSPIKVFFGAISKHIQHFVTDVLGLTGWFAAGLLLVLALVMIVVALLYITRIMRTLMAARVERALNEVLGKRGVLAIVIGTIMTVAVQSSSITTSLLIPMIGAGVLSLEAAFPVTLGANLGTTVTGLLAALAAGPAGLTIALVHALFNLVGIILVYPIPSIRRIPIRLAQGLANRAIENRAWVAVYIVGVFVVMPLLGIVLFK
ncbi:MAG: Na/Pi symporter [Planctomycetota bacterium]|nr:Na/Pi symporter [Planctomycetota bacterium]